MKIKLEYPYSEIWDTGYVVINPEGRKTLILYNSQSDRSSTQYARYIMAVHLGRFLNKDEHIDHIDGDITNNNLENLQILTPAENNRKSNKKPDVKLICPVCNIVFYRTRSQISGKLHKVSSNSICCSRSCGSKYGYYKWKSSKNK